MQTPSAFDRNYIAIADHGLQVHTFFHRAEIGNLHTAALVSIDGSIESYCVPDFDSPSVFARILDKDKGGHFSITPTVAFSTKQNYLPSSNILQTKFLNEKGVVSVTDFLPRQARGTVASNKPLLHWLVRRVEVIRGNMSILMQCAPAFNYARSCHTTTIEEDNSSPVPQRKAVFVSDALTLELRCVTDSLLDNVLPPEVNFQILDLSAKGHQGLAVSSEMTLHEGQVVTFVLRSPPPTELEEEADPLAAGSNMTKSRPSNDPYLTKSTNKYWNDWIRNSHYSGSWKEAVHRSALALKLLIYEPTGAVVASPTFSLPEYIGGTRNWDYRASWIRDSSFTLYALVRLGFTHEANAYMEFIFERLRNKNADGSIQIMYTIHGKKDLEEIELTHLDGHKGSKPVRIGNGAADHLQLAYDDWQVFYVVANWRQPDLSIWEVRNKKRQFTVRLRIADKRSLPCPKRNEWLATRDEIYEEIMARAWNRELQHFGQSYEEANVLDSAVLIMPLVFFMQASDPRFINTLKQILKTPERGGLTSNNLVFRYDVHKADDGVGGEEGTFGLCTLWCVEALTRAGKYDRAMLQKAVSMFEDFLLYLNHVGLCTEEISDAGEGLGNAVQGFTHVTLISAAYNLSRTLGYA
ncbi:glycoside hydrolase family 15 protein [Lentinula aciculospora]|uniref:Glycoside hydrolase family 15 protein n=1 Tax=Lentinula aciculospora TaxID=153920 RepID=A0A9W9DYQ0_9AGAR|nr:glycoside hydrolase family 15 protein [Lentinula aciculospora]